MVISREPLRYKLVVHDKPIEQVQKFKYLGAGITNARDIYDEVRTQVIKAGQVSDCLRDIIWNNKYLTVASKVKIYKACVWPILTYAAETRAETRRTKNVMRTTEMRTSRSIVGVSLRDRIRSSQIREQCKVQDVVRWVRARRRLWRDHVLRMENDRIVKAAMIQKPNTKRPPKRWYESWTSGSQDNS